MMTSSPGRTPNASRARCSAVVPLEQVTACSVLQNSANASSNRCTYVPTEEIQLLWTQSVTYFSSLPTSAGFEMGMNSCRFVMDAAPKNCEVVGEVSCAARRVHPRLGTREAQQDGPGQSPLRTSWYSS